MAGQFQLYAILGRLRGAPPVPRVIYFSADSSVLGSPFYIVQREPGTPFSDYAVPAWWAAASESFRDQVCCQYVRAFASLTALRPLDLLGPIATPRAECERWQHFARTARHDTLVGLARRLIDIPYSSSGPPAPVHGDPKMANVLWADGKLQSACARLQELCVQWRAARGSWLHAELLRQRRTRRFKHRIRLRPECGPGPRCDAGDGNRVSQRGRRRVSNGSKPQPRSKQPASWRTEQHLSAICSDKSTDAPLCGLAAPYIPSCGSASSSGCFRKKLES